MKHYKIRQMAGRIAKHLNSFDYPYRVFGIFGLITYPGYYLIWHFLVKVGYENLFMRLIATALCIPLIFEKNWPGQFKKYIGLYWHLTILYCLPFYFTFNLLKNNFSYPTVLNTFTVIVLTILLLETSAMLITLLLGSALGWLYFTVLNTGYIYPNVDYLTIFITYSTAIIFGAIFSYKKSNLQQERIAGMQLVASSIAHEIRTPLAAINLRIQGLKNKLKIFFQQMGIIEDGTTKEITDSLNKVEANANKANMVINMLLLNLSPVENTKSQERVSVNDCIEAAINTYPFKSSERETIQCVLQDNFSFIGSEILFTHVLYNLIKNALYFTSIKEGISRTIIIKTDKLNRKIYVRDNGVGINKKELGFIFDKFYTKTHHGSGIGLAFCKEVVELFCGQINCDSVLYEFTEFCIKLPETKRD